MAAEPSPKAASAAPDLSLGLQPMASLSMGSIVRAQDTRKSRSRLSWWLLGVGLALTVLVAVLGVALPSLGVVGVVGLALLAGFFQVLSVIVAGRTGPSEDSVRTQLAQAMLLSQRLEELRIKTERIYDNGTAEQRRRLLGEISSAFTYLQDSATLAFHGWAGIYPHMVINGQSGSNEKQSTNPRGNDGDAKAED